MATNTRPSPPNTPNPVELLSKLLDKGYTQATAQVIRSIARDTEVGPLAERLKQFDQHAAELAAKGEPLTPNDPVLRALLADFGDALKKDALLIDAAAPDVQSLGIDAAGQFTRQTSLPGFSDAMLNSIGVSWNKPDPEAVNAAVGYVTSDAWKAELLKYSSDPVDQALEIAIRGIVAGQSPLTTARDLRSFIETMPAYRANSLMRTTQLESYRQATAINQDANRDILLVQIRMAALDDRTCLCCIGLHGTEVPVGEPIIDHDNGRCFSVTKVKGRVGEVITQRYIDDHPVQFTTGEDWFNALPEDRQKAIAGPRALDALKKGEVQLKDFVQPYQSPIFGDMVRQASLKTARANNAAGVTVPGFGKSTILSKDELNKFVSDAGLDGDQFINDLRGFTEIDYKNIRDAQTSTADEWVDEDTYNQFVNMANSIEAGLQSLPGYSGGPIYRGIYVEDIKDVQGGKLEVGGIFQNNALASFSRNNDSSFIRENNIIFRVTGNRSGVAIENAAWRPNEQEVLVPSNSIYRIQNIIERNTLSPDDPMYATDGWIVDMREVD